MKYKDILNILKQIEDKEYVHRKYYSNNYCTYMGEWMNGASQKEYDKLKIKYSEFLDSEIEL